MTAFSEKHPYKKKQLSFIFKLNVDLYSDFLIETKTDRKISFRVDNPSLTTALKRLLDLSP